MNFTKYGWLELGSLEYMGVDEEGGYYAVVEIDDAIGLLEEELAFLKEENEALRHSLYVRTGSGDWE